MEHQRGLPPTKNALQQPCRDPTSFSDPFVTPSMSSTPMERKSTAWYITDSYAEQFSPPGSRFPCAQSSFEIRYPLPAVPPKQQQSEILGWSLKPKPPEKRLLLSDLQPPQPQQQRNTLQATDGLNDGDGENTDPGLSVKSGAVDDQQVLPIPLDSDVIMKIRYVSSSRRIFLPI